VNGEDALIAGVAVLADHDCLVLARGKWPLSLGRYTLEVL
jgi:hypothetical protein